MPPFSRLQLAAALIEYDNDPDDPDGPYRSAEESAIFLFLKGRPQPRNTIMGYDAMPRRSVDFLGVALPGETERPVTPGNQQDPSKADTKKRRSLEMLAGGRKTPDGRRSAEPLSRPLSELARMNGSMFRGGDGEDSEGDDDELVAEGPELNLASWGIDEFLVKEKPRPRSRADSVNAYNAANTVGGGPRPRADSRGSSYALHDANIVGGNRRSMGARAQSMGDWGVQTSVELEPWEAARTSMYSSRPRPSSMADLTEIASRNQNPPVAYRSRSRAGSVMSMSGQQAIAFPGTITPCAEATPNPFEIPEPSAGNASRFDPKTIAHQRTLSLASMGSRHGLAEGGNAEFNDNASFMTGAVPPGGPNRFSRIDLLRPKVLIMPALLQDAPEEAPPPPKPIRDGFMESTDSRPLPPGAKTARLSTYGGFGVNPRSSMTLSQLTFRNSLIVGGQRDPSYADLETNLKRAEKEGEMIQGEVYLEPEVEDTVPHRAAGKLYGRSLIDDLEARKAQIKGKQRVFRGDERPSMMQRPQPTRSGTLIDAQALQQNALGAVRRPELHRNPSSKEPLLDFRTDPIPGTTVQPRPQMGRAGGSLPNARSVFGVDQIWEKELAKLQQIEALEKAEEEEIKRQEAEQKARQEARAAKKAAKQAKGKNKPLLDTELNRDQLINPNGISPIARASEAPPLLPTVNPFAMPPKVEESSDSDSDVEPEVFNRAQSRVLNSKSQQDWLSDDERQAAPARPPPRPRQQASAPIRKSSSFAAGLHLRKSDSEDSDVPLTSALARAKQRQQAEDSEDDKPLTAVLSNSLSTLDFGGTILTDVKKPVERKVSMPQPRSQALRDAKRDSNDDEDDKPLALRASRFGLGGGDDDDEKPLGMRYSMVPSQMIAQQQQQQQQQQVMMQQQMMQQQLMAAASMRGSMFNPMMMGNMGIGFGNSMNMPGVNSGMMAMPGLRMGMMDTGSVDPAKLSAVDRWRRGVGGAEDG